MHYTDRDYHEIAYNEHDSSEAARAAVMRAKRMELMALRQIKQEKADALRLGIMAITIVGCILAFPFVTHFL